MLTSCPFLAIVIILALGLLVAPLIRWISGHL